MFSKAPMGLRSRHLTVMVEATNGEDAGAVCSPLLQAIFGPILANFILKSDFFCGHIISTWFPASYISDEKQAYGLSLVVPVLLCYCEEPCSSLAILASLATAKNNG